MEEATTRTDDHRYADGLAETHGDRPNVYLEATGFDFSSVRFIASWQIKTHTQTEYEEAM